VVVREGPAHLGDTLFELPGNIRDHKLVQGIQVSPADRFRDSVRDGLGLFGGEASLLMFFIIRLLRRVAYPLNWRHRQIRLRGG